ncbi:uncharacterized protein BDZ99DRAFT_463977 [Mytilinidion resinicola]|uniref:Uncharacterized protein n=1 Tax=Mytilinidion resinicola TaxID=574789 RepID=A0A6A6YMG7_9PEZI|nr:uncharacterized protein BDZ99DRAFT_463977 [Mytilinidion resinicola]KAF2809175.1 hypothetical protein BDZ99DRAFT_463977 [Mytilinidion resinicola]
MEDHPNSRYSGWVEYWVDFKKGVADGNLIQVMEEPLYYHETTSRVIRNELALFKQLVEPLRLQWENETLTTEDMKKFIETLLEMHGNFVV